MKNACFSLILVLCFLSAFFSTAEANFAEDDSEFSEIGDKPYPYNPNGETITAKFIFVAFPDDSSGLVVTLNEHQNAVNGIISYVNEHSQGQLVLGPNSGILLHPGETLDANNPIRLSWEAERYARDYKTGGCDDCVELPQQEYLDLWEPLVSNWYSEEEHLTNRATELLAEIFWKIKDEYETAGIDPFGEEVGAIFVIFQSVDSPDALAGGRPHISLNCENISAETDFFSSLKIVDNEFAGTMSVQASASPVTPDFNIEKCMMTALHEFVHTLGPDDGPPSFNYMRINCGEGNLCEYRYYYGNQNLMCQHYIPGYGVPPIVLPILETLPWFSEENGRLVDFTGQNKYGTKIYDIRSNNGVIYNFRLGYYPNKGNEDFVIAYHSGVGIDAILPSQGLEIWHRVGDTMYDLESSIGNWAYGTADLDHYIYPADCSVIADTLGGYDNHDVWQQQNEVARSVSEYENYIGESYDFFQVDSSGEGGQYNNDEFSFRTNPRSYGYNKEEDSHKFLRRRPQDVSNSLVIKILGTGTDAMGNYMTVDLLSAPGGVVLSPSCVFELPVYMLGDIVPIIWEHDEYDEAAESVDILFSKYGGDFFQETLVEDLPIGSGVGSWDWLPTAEHGTNQGRIRVVFNNPFSEHTNSADSDCNFVIEAPMVVEEYIVSPNGGEIYSAGHSSTIPITWTNLFADVAGEEVDSVDLSFSTDDGVTWSEVESGLTSSVDYFVDPETGHNVFEMLLTDEMVGEKTRVRLDFHSGSDVATQISESSFVVYPVEAIFSDVSDGSGASYQGEPYNAISLDYNSDGKQDLLISMQDFDEAVEANSELFRNEGDENGPIIFDNRTNFDFSPSSPAPYNNHGLSAGDYDNDGQEDIFITHENSPRLYRNNNGIFEDKTQEVISGLDLPYLLHSSCAVWVDYDHDSDLDLFVGRVANLDGGPLTPHQDYILKNNGTGGFSGVLELGNPGYTSSAVWCDFNQDGLWEVVVGDFGSGTALALTTMFVESYPRGFIEIEGGLPPGFDRAGVSSLNWTDFDRDGDLDLFVTKTAGHSEILKNNQGNLDEVIPLVYEDASWLPATAVPLDYNLDGWPDFVLSNPVHSPHVRLMANFLGNPKFTENTFGDITAATGLSDFSGPATGILPCDFNNDGDLDLFLGNYQSNSSGNTWLLGNSQKDGQETPMHNYVRIKVDPLYEKRAYLGAVVSVETVLGAPLGTQVFDGGSGLGGQMPRILVVGLGDYVGGVNVVTHWPRGRVSSTVVSSALLNLGEVVPIKPESDLQIFDSTIKRSIVFDPVSLVFHWTITWQTDFWSDQNLDMATIARISGLNCGPDTVNLQAGDPDVVVQKPEYFVDSSTGMPAYKHQLEWTNQPCHLSCQFSIEVESSNGINSDSGFAGTDVKFKTCPVSVIQGGQ